MCGKEPVIPQQMGVGGLGLIFLSLGFITLMISEVENVLVLICTAHIILLADIIGS